MEKSRTRNIFDNSWNCILLGKNIILLKVIPIERK